MFRLFGFDVQVRTGFVIFLALIVFLYQDAFGLWLAGGIAVFTLLHELGHAVAARSAGAHAEISLDFLAGYTSFRPQRPISRPRQALISAAGPLTQIGVSLAVLVAMGVDPFSFDSIRQTDATAAIWWAGPAIGALNLIPVLPLDGGHLAQTGLETFLGERAFRVMAIASLTMTAGGAALLFLSGRGGFAIFVLFLLFHQVQLVQASSPKRQGSPVSRHVDAESTAWQTGRPGMLEPGQRLSPWYEAHRALAAGDRDRAARAVLDDLASPGPSRWAVPVAASPHQLRAIVDVLPRDLPAGNPYSARVMADVLLACGDVPRAGEYAAAAFGRHRSSPLASIVARSAAIAGDDANALAWLRAATEAAEGESGPYRDLLGRTMDQAPELVRLRTDPAFQSLRADLA